MSPSLAVLGAGGRTGLLIVDEALRAGHRVTAVVRTPDRSPLRPRDGLTVVAGDARDAGSLCRLLAPDDVVVCAVGPPGRRSDGLYADCARAVVTASDAIGVRRFVGITSSGVRGDDPNHPWWYRRFLVPIMRSTYSDMAQMEEIIERSALAWTFVRPTRLLDAEPDAPHRVHDGANPPGGTTITRRDVARFVVAAAADDAWARSRPTLAR